MRWDPGRHGCSWADAARPPANRTSRRGSTVDDETTDQSSALHRAVFRGDQRLVERLLRSANARSLAAAQDSAGATALDIAAQYSHSRLRTTWQVVP